MQIGFRGHVNVSGGLEKDTKLKGENEKGFVFGAPSNEAVPGMQKHLIISSTIYMNEYTYMPTAAATTEKSK